MASEGLLYCVWVLLQSIRPEAILPLYHVFAAGPVTRREFAQMTGLGERTAGSLLSHLLAKQ